MISFLESKKAAAPLPVGAILALPLSGIKPRQTIFDGPASKEYHGPRVSTTDPSRGSPDDNPMRTLQ